MKIGDLVRFVVPSQRQRESKTCLNSDLITQGLVVDFPLATHAKQFRIVTVLTDTGLEHWVMQFCEVVDESR